MQITVNQKRTKTYVSYERAVKAAEDQIKKVVESTKLEKLSHVWWTVIAVEGGRFAPTFLLGSENIIFRDEFIGLESNSSKGFKTVQQD